MTWLQLTTHSRFHSNADGSAKKYVLPVQDFGLQVRTVIYAVELLDGTANAKLALYHVEGAGEDPTFFSNTLTPIPSAATGAPRKTIKGSVSGDDLLPMFQPVVEVSSTGGSMKSVLVNVYVGGRSL
jgi:hypothetical protein